jgi:hypothetical protein
VPPTRNAWLGHRRKIRLELIQEGAFVEASQEHRLIYGNAPEK